MFFGGACNQDSVFRQYSDRSGPLYLQKHPTSFNFVCFAPCRQRKVFIDAAHRLEMLRSGILLQFLKKPKP